MNNNKVAFYLLGYKGYSVLQNFLTLFSAAKISAVVIGEDKKLDNDFSEDIKTVCLQHNIAWYQRNERADIDADIVFLIGWRWMVAVEEEKLIVLHDSLLPKYRGFNPLVTALINKDDTIGVTALYANSEYDKGNIIAQKSLTITYPLKISKAIELITPLYSDLVVKISYNLFNGIPLNSTKQDESLATYSVWRDQYDYRIDWQQSALTIARFVDAVGAPYEGAQTTIDDELVIILETEPLSDIVVENRIPGKVIFVENGYPIVLCGEGLLKIKKMIAKNSKENMLPLKKFRTRFV